MSAEIVYVVTEEWVHYQGSTSEFVAVCRTPEAACAYALGMHPVWVDPGSAATWRDATGEREVTVEATELE